MVSTISRKPLPLMGSLHAVSNQTKLSEATKHWLVKISKLSPDLTPFQQICSYFSMLTKNLLNHRTLHPSAFLKMRVLDWRVTHPFLQCKNTFDSLKYILIVQPCSVIVWVGF